MKVYKRAGHLIKNQEYLTRAKEKFILNLIKKHGGDAYYRKGNFTNEIIWDGKSYMFPQSKNHRSFIKGGFLYRMVRSDAKRFLAKGNKIPLPKKYPVNEYNEAFDKFGMPITGTDVNHAYWRIAYNLGIISKRTYERGLNDDFKTVRLSALSTLGSGRDYQIIKQGNPVNNYIKIGTDEDLNILYKAIRYTCYKQMQKIKRKLKDDFVAYRTDCIYYVDTPENRKMVREFFKKNNLEVKQLYRIRKSLHEQTSS